MFLLVNMIIERDFHKSCLSKQLGIGDH